MPNIRIYAQNYPSRVVALVAAEHALVFRYGSIGLGLDAERHSKTTPRCLVEFTSLSSLDLQGFRLLGDGHGTLGLITLGGDVFLCVVTGSCKAATIRPGETVSRIENVEFFCLNHSKYEDTFDFESQSSIATGEFSHGMNSESKEQDLEIPFLALKKLLSDGSFYYSLDFNLTDRLQDRSDHSTAFDIDSLDQDMLWNSYMINPLLIFRNKLSLHDKWQLDSSQILTCVIRGFCGTLAIPASAQPLPHTKTYLPASLTLISRQSSRRAGTRFNSRGIDDDGHVANFVETETLLWIAPDIIFSYVQIRGSVPLFWEQATGFLPGQQKIEITRSMEATRHAFEKHFRLLELEYGTIHVINLLSELKPGEVSLSSRFRDLLRDNSQSQIGTNDLSNGSFLQMTEFDFHAEARGPLGYGASVQIKHEIFPSLQGFAYFQSGEVGPMLLDRHHAPKSSSIVLQQEGVFRTNCLDCLDRTNLVQTIISSMALECFFSHQGGELGPDVQLRHSTLWADNGDALSKIYAGTGALKSSFTRHGKMSIAGALADARKTATRIYVNNFSDKARQNTIDHLLGRLTDQAPVQLYDPINDLVTEELSQRSSEYSFTRPVKIWTGTFNVNGRHQGPEVDLRPWLFPDTDHLGDDPLVYAVGFQEIVELSPQQIMSTDPTTRKVWEVAVHSCLNNRAMSRGIPKYVLLRSGQLVGTALIVYVREDILHDIKNVEGSVKKTGLSGMAGNKGGCAIRFEYSSTRICFVTAHLAAGFANYDERNRDYETILRGLRFLRNRSIDDHDSIVWLGDFNYRIGLSNQKARELAQEGDFQTLYDNDQLNLQMVAGRAFHFYTEGPITFPPTYKYDIGGNEYDTSEKARIPAWCDRILWRGSNLRQWNYGIADLRLSDHRPVLALFTCMIHVIDEGRKSKLQQALYTQRQSATHTIPADTSKKGGTEKSVSISPEIITAKFPFASSDYHKWWLKNETPVKSELRPPAEGLVLNINRDSNPFLCDDNTNWTLASVSTERCTTENRTKKPTLPPRIMPNYLSPHSRDSKGMMVAPARVQIPIDAERASAEAGDKSKIIPPVPRKPTSCHTDSIPEAPIQETKRPAGHDPAARVKDSQFGARVLSHGSRRLDHLGSLEQQKDSRPDSLKGALTDVTTSTATNDLLGEIHGDHINWNPLIPK
ncbi:SacI domain and endonuclease/exonuclease/phosphatase family protein [Aspergillus heteromorphus CBS 117.55]|uniref:phosphoinositide 5-phosphatase n=1 Tax=Aspergillus heteromorphus CBS 117.55 TaxID=1448321 RepID=A0A317UW64_9EURO|nr:SacI domain and endonuclease/exonuclease/phosphatase family protein [Aspergillus heteromorphus CBS 117.55]PWY64722.1 SacI domain and endonuclease/exonuclease/phosphatase family protein [Aspergillus heteromorphus CBS 117.55]